MHEPVDLLSFEENIRIDEEARVHFKDIIRWGKFVSITSLIILVVVALILFIASQQPGSSFNSARVTPYLFIMWGMIITCAVIESILLYRFSAICEHALANEDMIDLNRGLKALKIFFIISGVLGIIICFFSAFSLV